MKLMNLTVLAAAILTVGNVASAADAKNTNRCVIYVSSNHPVCHGALVAGAAQYYTVNAWFVDTDPLANLNAGRCLERAKEYKAWCGDGNLIKANYVYAFFQTNDGTMNVISSVEGTDDKTYLGDGVARLLRWHD